MLKDSLINTIMVATGEWLNALRRKDMVAVANLECSIGSWGWERNREDQPLAATSWA